MPEMYKEDLIERLRSLDEAASLLFPFAERIKIIIVGGGALVLMEYISRATHDIDVIQASHQMERLFSQYDMNTRVQTYINNFPYNYEDRIKKVDIHGRLIDFFTASLEDIIVAKLYSYRDSDYADICAPSVLEHIDWDVLRHLAVDDEEAHANSLNEYRYREFLDRYHEYERRFRPCES